MGTIAQSPKPEAGVRSAPSVRRAGPAERSEGTRGGPAAPLPRQLGAFLAVLFLFSLGNSADAFLLLRVSESLGSATYIPLLWSAFHVVKASLSTWGGALSDRLGRKRVIVMGWAIYAVVYLGFATARTAWSLIGWFLLYGTYFALTEGAEKALVADLTPPRREGTAFGLYNATLGVGTLAASVAFGFLYERYGATVAFGTGSALAALGTVILTWRIGRRLHGAEAGLLAGLVMATLVGNALYVRKASTDQLFVFCLTLAMYGFLRDADRADRGRARFLLFYLGVALGVGAATAVTQLARWPTEIQPSAVALAFGFATGIGVFFGYYPALRASTLDPVEALRYE